MDTLVMEATAKSNVSVRRTLPVVKPKTAKILDEYYISLTKQIEAGLKPSISFEKVEEALASGSVSPDVIDDMEDAMFGQILVEELDDDDEYVSEDEIMKILDE